METPFYDHLTSQDFEKVYAPAEDTFLLLDAIEDDLKYLENLKPRMCLEIGSGSGLIITAVSKRFPQSLCISTDINIWACKATKRTGARNNVVIDTIRTNLIENFRPNVIDMLIFNPPYVVTTDSELEHNGKEFDGNVTNKNLIYSWAGGINGRRVIDELIQNLDLILSSDGVLYLLVLRENMPKDIINVLKEKKFNAVEFKERRIIGEHLFVIKVTR